MAGSEDYTMVDSTIEHEMQPQLSVSTPPRPSLSGYSWNTRDARYQPFPEMGDRHQSDMAEMCRPNPLPRWIRARNYARPRKEPFSSFRNYEETDESEISFPTLVCQRLGCWQETPHEHSEDETAQLNRGCAKETSDCEDFVQHVTDFVSHFADDEKLMKDLLPPELAHAPIRPPPRLRGPGSSRSLIDGSKQGTRELRRALPTISETPHRPASSMTLPIRPRPPSPVVELPDLSVDSAEITAATHMEVDPQSPRDEMSATTTRLGDLVLEDPEGLSFEEVLAAELQRDLDADARRDGTLGLEDDVK